MTVVLCAQSAEVRATNREAERLVRMVVFKGEGRRHYTHDPPRKMISPSHELLGTDLDRGSPRRPRRERNDAAPRGKSRPRPQLGLSELKYYQQALVYDPTTNALPHGH